MRKLVAILTIAILMMATSAMALTYSPTLNDLLNFKVLGTSPVEEASLPYDDGLGEAYFTVKFEPTPYTNAYAAYGLTFSSPLNLSGYDKYQLVIANLNENPWNFGLFIGETLYSAPTSIANETSGLLTLDLTSLSDSVLANVTNIGLYVTANVPIVGENNRYDYNAEFAASPVPEPGTMVLLGAGLLGLAIYGKRRMNKEA